MTSPCRSPRLLPSLPSTCRRSEVDPEHLEHEKEILIAQARNEGKPEKIIEKMVRGPHQEVLQGSLPAGAALRQGWRHQRAEDDRRQGQGRRRSSRFTRYKMGDGLEKKVNDLAAEVAAQTAGMAK